MKLLDVKDLTVKYQYHVVLKNIDFSVNRGDYIAIVGPNGAGKTTFIKTLLGLTETFSGSIEFKTYKIGYLQQRISMNDVKFPANVKEIIKSGLLINKKFPRFFTQHDEVKINHIINKLDIEKLAGKLVGKLSGGELQKVLLARALVSEPEILFLDEPATALDPESRDKFYELLKELNSVDNITILLISHDIGSVGKYAKKLLYIDQKVIFYGTFEEFCHSADMTQYFGSISQHFFCQRHN